MKKECATPFASPMPWRATIINIAGRNGEQVTVQATYWFDARKEASRLLRCEPGVLDVRAITEDRSSVAKGA